GISSRSGGCPLDLIPPRIDREDAGRAAGSSGMLGRADHDGHALRRDCTELGQVPNAVLAGAEHGDVGGEVGAGQVSPGLTKRDSSLVGKERADEYRARPGGTAPCGLLHLGISQSAAAAVAAASASAARTRS